jgi:hypothetical protein
MNSRELQSIRQRLTEGYYHADAEALGTMRLLLETVDRLREDESNMAEELTMSLPRS